MARKQASETASSSKSAAKRPTKKTKNGATVNGEDDPEVLVLSSSSSDSLQAEEEAGEEASDNEDNHNDEEDELVVEDNDDEDEGEEVGEDAAAAAAVEKSKKTEGSNKKKNKKKSKDNCNGAVDEPSLLYRFPMQRVSRIIKSEDPGIRISNEATFIINKASEMFLQLYSMEAYACAFLDRKKFVAYNHLSSVVTKRKRFDFLSDFVPEKLKAEDALKEIPSIDNS